MFRLLGMCFFDCYYWCFCGGLLVCCDCFRLLFVVVGVRFPICCRLGFDVSGSVLLLGVLVVGLCCLFYYGFISCFVALVVAWFEVLTVLMVACCGLLVLDCFYCGLECLLSACFYLLRCMG